MIHFYKGTFSRRVILALPPTPVLVVRVFRWFGCIELKILDKRLSLLWLRFFHILYEAQTRILEVRLKFMDFSVRSVGWGGPDCCSGVGGCRGSASAWAAHGPLWGLRLTLIHRCTICYWALSQLQRRVHLQPYVFHFAFLTVELDLAWQLTHTKNVLILALFVTASTLGPPCGSEIDILGAFLLLSAGFEIVGSLHSGWPFQFYLHPLEVRWIVVSVFWSIVIRTAPFFRRRLRPWLLFTLCKAVFVLLHLLGLLLSGELLFFAHVAEADHSLVTLTF